VGIAGAARVMSSRAAFGDFIRAADQHLDQAFAELANARASADEPTLVRETTCALRRFVAVINRYAADLTPTSMQVPEQDRPLMTAWGRASVEAREALQRSAALLRPASSSRDPRPDDAGPSRFCCCLESAAMALDIGRDLLGTHFATSIDGVRQGHSEWAPVIDSGPVSRVLLTEVVSFGAVAGARCARLARPSRPSTPETTQARRRLNAACHQLMVASTAVQAGQADPVHDDARELLHAIPVNAEPSRPIQRGSETIADLCEGAIMTAERARRASRALAREPPGHPRHQEPRFRRAAAACAVTSYHCEVLLQSLAAQYSHHRDAHLRSQLLRSADAVRTPAPAGCAPRTPGTR